MRAVLSLLFCLATLLTSGFSQLPSADNKDQAYIIESAETRAEFQNDGNYVRNEKLTILIQADAGLQQWGSIRFTYPAEHSTMEVIAVTVTKPDGSVVKTDTTNLQDLPAAITQQMPFYSDVHEKHAVVKGLSIGDRLTYEYTLRSTKPVVPGEFWFDYSFNDAVITKRESVVVIVPADRAIKLRSIEGDPTIERTSSKVTYSWTHSNLKLNPNAKEEGPDPKDVLSRSAPPDIQLSSFASWEQIGKWYASLQTPMMQVTPEIAAKAKELTANKPDAAEKAKVLAAYVGTNIRYVGIELGIGRYQPHAASEVMANAYGDCKDKHTLLAAMLQAIGIKAEPALISSKLELDRSVPTISVFDHVITAVEIAGKREFVDATGEVYPYGYLPRPLRDKDVLLATAAPAMVRTPAATVANAETFDMDAALSPEGVLSGKVTRDVVGDSEILVRSIFRKVPPAQWKQVVQGMSAYSGFGGTVDNVKVTTPEDLQARFTITYDYERKDYGGFKDGYTSPALPSMLLMNPLDLDKRKKSVVLTPGTMEETSKIKMPPGAMLRAPDPVDLVEEFAEYHSKYRFEGGVLHSKKSLAVKQTTIEPARFGAFRRFLKTIQDERSDQIALILPAGTSKSTNANKEAIELFNKSRDAFRMGAPSEAIRHLKKLAEVDPDYPNAWGMLGSAYLMMGQKDLGVEALRKQIAQNPKELVGYRVLGEYYAGTNMVPLAIDVWKEYLKNVPDDNDVKLTVARLETRAKHYPEAGAIYAELLKAKPDDPALMLESAGVRLAGGETEPAFTAFQEVLKRQATAQQKNNVAYMLIEKKVHLDDAMKWAEEAVHEIEGKSSRIDLAEVTMEDNATTVTLAMYWDTLGWGYFQAGDFAQATKYLQSASAISEDPVIVEHYAEALEKSGTANKAMEAYALAASLGSGPGSSRAMSRLRVLAPGRADLLKGQAGSHSSMMRTFKVSGPAGVKSVSSSDVLLLIGSDGKIADVKWLQDSPLAKSDAQLRALDPRMRFPSEHPAKVLRRGIFMCSSITGCNLTLLTPNTVQSVD